MLKLNILLESETEIRFTRGLVKSEEVLYFYELLPDGTPYFEAGARSCLHLATDDIYCIETLEEIEDKLKQINMGLWDSQEDLMD